MLSALHICMKKYLILRGWRTYYDLGFTVLALTKLQHSAKHAHVPF